MAKHDDIPSASQDEIESLIGRIERGELDEADRRKVGRLLRLLLTLISVVQEKNYSIKRLKRMLFGPSTDKRADAGSKPSSDSTSSSSSSKGPNDEGAKDSTPSRKPLGRGHGRLPTSAYTGATRVRCSDPTLVAGAPCPSAPCSGTLYDTRHPSIFIRLEGQPLVGAVAYEQDVVRCSACQTRFTAPLPASVPPEKWDATADVAIALAKYSAGLPFYRLARVQSSFGVPLPASVQWERVEAVADALHPVFLHLETLAARGEVLYADDTTVRILSCLKENETLAEGERTGTFTTGIVSRVDGHTVVLYKSSRRHAGENVGALLAARPSGLAPPVQIGDAISRNWSHAFTVVVAKCLAHARRQFVDIERAFPDECARVLDDLAAIYRFDAETEGMSVEARLSHHQLHSAPVFEALRAWIGEQIDERRVEPNSSLGKAIKYLLTHWEALTRCLSDGRAPLDTNVVERALKLAVLNRKNSLFYRNEHGAAVGDMLTSIVETCRIEGVQAWDYLVAIVRNARAVRERPEAWLPWTYRRGAKASDRAA